MKNLCWYGNGRGNLSIWKINGQLLFLRMELKVAEKVEGKLGTIKVVKSGKIELEELGII